MKKALLSITLFIAVAFSAVAQSYDLTASTETYNNLTGATAVYSGSWDDGNTTVPIGFPFKLFGGNTLDSLVISANGVIKADAGAFSPGYRYYFSVFEADLVSRPAGNSTVSYRLDGTAPNRIFKVEWKDAGFTDEGGNFDSYMNNQLWLYEGSNVIEMRVGPNSVNYAGFDIEDVYYSLQDFTPEATGGSATTFRVSGDAANPTLNQGGLTAVPSSGTVFRFEPAEAASTRSLNSFNFDSYPNPVQDILYVRSENLNELRVSVLDFSGRTIHSLSTQSNEAAIDLTGIATGVYLIKVQSGNEISFKKIIKN